ncbi:glycosyltransferase family 39 protein [Sphingomonas sp. MMS24-J45]|uniref:glycosyltransferase family 39 protein n=1 Tax=Sphingomonas sp. MMS24-J45 TaxID=3238806 RepID=UPI0038510F10
MAKAIFRGLAGRLAVFEAGRWIVPAIFALALGLRIAALLLVPQFPVSDGEWYMVRAAEMARGMGYQEAGHPTAFWPVGYPGLLAGSMILFGPGLLGPLLANLASTALILWAILRLGRALDAGALASRVAILLYALYPAHIAYAGQPCAETASTAIGMVAFVLLIVGRKQIGALLLAGLLFGLATLMRAQMMLFPAGVIVALLLAFRDFRVRDAVRAGLLIHLALAATVLPWSLRNVAEMGSFVPVSTNGGVSLFYGANDRATGDWFAWERTPYWDQTVGIPYAQRVERQVEIDRRFSAKAKAWIAAHPGRWTVLGVKKVALLWLKDSDAFWSFDKTYPDQNRLLRVVQALDQLYYVLLVGLGLATLAVAARARLRGVWDQAPLLMLGCMPAFVTLTAFGFTGQTRYHYPAMPCLILAAGWMIARVLRALAARERRATVVLRARTA